MAKQLTHRPDTFQQQAIDSTSRGIRIVAPAGSGKSETLARRVAKRIEKDKVEPQSILVLTFDKAAKKSLRNYFSGLNIKASFPIQTYDDFAKILLRKYFPDDISSRWSFEGDASTNEVVQQIRAEFEHKIQQFKISSWDGSKKTRETTFRAIKNEGYSANRPGERQALKQWLANDYFRLPYVPEEFIDNPQVQMPSEYVYSAGLHRNIDRLIDCLIHYDERMASAGYRDLIDRKLRTIDLLRDDNNILKIVKEQYSEIVVDEAQDISRSDALLVWLVAHQNAHVVLAGDDDQTIYRWKNASAKFLKDPTLIFGTERRFDLVTLDWNYRSPKSILDPALKLISHNIDRIEKTPKSALEYEGSVTVKHSPNAAQHDQALLRMIRQEIESGLPSEEIAVIAFTNNHQVHLTGIMRHAGLPVAGYKRDGSVASPGVHVITDYKAKGNEWPVVFLANVNDDNIPGKKATTSEDLESKRREMYVTLTRSTRRLVIQYTRTAEIDEARANQRGEIIWTNGASRFLFEAGLVGQNSHAAPAELAAPPQESGTIVDRWVSRADKSGGEHRRTTSGMKQPANLDESQVPSKTNAIPQTKKDSRDHITRDSWHELEGYLRHIAKEHHLTGGESSRDIVQSLHLRGILQPEWKRRFTKWRLARNDAEHHSFSLGLNKLSRSEYLSYSDELSQQLQLAKLYLSTILETPFQRTVQISNRLYSQARLVEHIAEFQLGELGSLPMRTYEFPDVSNGGDILSFQLHLILREIKFQCSDEIRWDTSPLLNEYVEKMVGTGLDYIRPSIRNRLVAKNDSDRSEVYAQLDEILNFECSRTDEVAAFLQGALGIASDSRNGRLSDGVILGLATRPDFVEST